MRKTAPSGSRDSDFRSTSAALYASRSGIETLYTISAPSVHAIIVLPLPAIRIAVDSYNPDGKLMLR
jgi:hypothetical protein